ncbi:acyl-CoA dehydrogenase family protein [Nonomuraea dietziae]|uniref:Alkylation response protein AidB-like acyl-CoA dehydrogenase n=1 Tax=Nonomuraea dietziae TaxID=65515 RepID=A0A7W5YMF8_9ACTN|nr:acyl-CoA dehydrogenase family protein [Nonomuraea dietziae]MBB3726277.1 alkylation response protein AidB-like acyl-CoA dehydrogenase [Nonomuraea dietziae]
MNFELDEDQQLFRATLREFVDKEIVPVASEWERSGRYPAEIVERFKELGLFGMTIPSEYGGLDLDRVSYALVFEEIARGWMGVAGVLGSHSLSAWMINQYGTQDQKERYLPDLASGARRTGIALTEPGAGTDLQGIQTRAERDGEHYVVNGAKTWITNARHADPMPVLVKTSDESPAHRGLSMLLVEAGTPGYTVSRDLPKLGYKGTETCEITLQDVRVHSDQLLGGVEGRGMQQALSALELGRVNIAARAVGVSQCAFDAALAYAGQREAFGRPIGDFQAIQLKLADMATEIQAARLMTYWAASRSARAEAAMAKYFASEVALRVTMEAMRVHGGYGYSQEFVLERLYRDAPLMAIGEGTNDVQRLVIARDLLSGAVKVGW